MSTFTTVTKASLTPEWVSGLLITAFDAQYGGCNYWLNDLTAEEGPEHLVGVDIVANADDPSEWASVTLQFERVNKPLTIFNGGRAFVHLGDPGDGSIVRTVTLEGKHLEQAWAEIVDTRPIRSDLVQQFLTSQAEGDLDVDADAADCLVQFALFGRVIYG